MECNCRDLVRHFRSQQERYSPGYYGGSGFERLFLPGIGAVAIQARLLLMQQVGQLLAVVHVGRCHTGTMNQTTGAIHTNVRLHAKVPLATFFSLVHFWVARFVLVFGGTGRGD